MKTFDKYINHIEAVNNSKTVEDHAANQLYLSAWMQGVKDGGGFTSGIMATKYYLDKGINRAMIDGIWTDWEPQ